MWGAWARWFICKATGGGILHDATSLTSLEMPEGIRTGQPGKTFIVIEPEAANEGSRAVHLNIKEDETMGFYEAGMLVPCADAKKGNLDPIR